MVANRQKAYQNYQNLLQQYINIQESTSTEALLAIFSLSNNAKKAPWEKQKDLASLEFQRAFMNQDHPTVWKEMQRQVESISSLKKLLHQVPEVLDWA